MSGGGSIRIISGQWRRRRLKVEPSHSQLRPTPDRVRETLFNWLAPNIVGASCLDLFAGTGALGFEAASRGAHRVTLVENDPQLVRVLNENCRMLAAANVEVIQQEAMAWLEAAREQYEIVFLDPPYGRYDLCQLICSLEQSGRFAAHPLVYLECAAKSDQPAPVPKHWRVLRDGRAGRVRYYLASPTENRQAVADEAKCTVSRNL